VRDNQKTLENKAFPAGEFGPAASLEEICLDLSVRGVSHAGSCKLEFTVFFFKKLFHPSVNWARDK
jgi:hypothetical protein